MVTTVTTVTIRERYRPVEVEITPEMVETRAEAPRDVLIIDVVIQPKRNQFPPYGARQPAAIASASEQNHCSPLASSIRVFAYPLDQGI